MTRLVRSVPFSIEVGVGDILNGILEIDGLLSFEHDTILLEYRTSVIPGFSSSGAPLKSIRIPLSDLQDIDYREKVFLTKVTFTPRRLSTIEGVPGDHSTDLKLRIKRKNRQRAAALVSEIQIAFARTRHSSIGSIPFLMPKASKDFTEVGGLLYTEDEFLVFELQAGISGGSRKSDQIVKIEKTAIRDISLSEALLKDVVSIQPKRQQLLDVIPGDHVDSVRLKVNSSYRSDVKALIRDILIEQAEDEDHDAREPEPNEFS
jgi:hypothetical protein